MDAESAIIGFTHSFWIIYLIFISNIKNGVYMELVEASDNEPQLTLLSGCTCTFQGFKLYSAKVPFLVRRLICVR